MRRRPGANGWRNTEPTGSTSRLRRSSILGEVSTGAQDDLQGATDLVRHMITRLRVS